MVWSHHVRFRSAWGNGHFSLISNVLLSICAFYTISTRFSIRRTPKVSHRISHHRRSSRCFWWKRTNFALTFSRRRSTTLSLRLRTMATHFNTTRAISQFRAQSLSASELLRALSLRSYLRPTYPGPGLTC